MSKRRKYLSSSDYKKIDYNKKSAVFLLPMIGVRMFHRNEKTDYLIDVGFLQRGFPQIVIIFDNIDYEPLKSDIHRLTMSPYFVDAEFDDDNKEVCLFLDIPKEFRIDFEFFVSGKYSQFSDNYKKLLTMHYGDGKDSGKTALGLPKVSLYDAIYPSKKMKMAIGEELAVDWRVIKEVLDPPNIELEEFKSIDELYGECKR